MMNTSDKNILRALVTEYMELSEKLRRKEKIELWKSLNRSKMQRPMVLIDQLPWMELACPELEIKCSDPYWQGVETNLRQTIYKAKNFPVDMVLDNFITIPKYAYTTGYGLQPKVELLGEEGTSAYSQHFENLLNTMDDVNKITDMQAVYNEEATKTVYDDAVEAFGDIAPVKLSGVSFHIGVWDFISQVLQPEEILFAFYDNPDLLHGAMERLTQSVIAGVEACDKLGIHNDIVNLCHCSHIYTDELLPDSGESKGPLAKNCWAFGLAQVFTSISPELFNEFEIPYVSRMAEKFGMLYYGCCDRLDDRLQYVKTIPNVKKVSCSPWSDRKNFAENIGNKIILSNKPNPAYLSDGYDEELIRKDLQLTCDLARANGVNAEFILKDVSTVKNQPERLNKWAEIAMSVVENY